MNGTDLDPEEVASVGLLIVATAATAAGAAKNACIARAVAHELDCHQMGLMDARETAHHTAELAVQLAIDPDAVEATARRLLEARNQRLRDSRSTPAGLT